jgi:hypothetical protein
LAAGLTAAPSDTVDRPLLAELKQLAASGNGKPVLSNLQRNAAGRPAFYVAMQLPNERIGFGILTTDYLLSLQQAIAFGDHGHAVITDAKGQVIAHPLKD